MGGIPYPQAVGEGRAVVAAAEEGTVGGCGQGGLQLLDGLQRMLVLLVVGILDLL